MAEIALVATAAVVAALAKIMAKVLAACHTTAAAATATATCALEHPPEARALQHHLGATGARAEKITQAKLSAVVTQDAMSLQT